MTKKKRTPAQLAAEWKPGQTGNSRGRPKKSTGMIKEILNEYFSEMKDGVERRTLLYRMVAQMAEGGDKWAIDFVADRTEGKAIERVESKEVSDFYYELEQLEAMTVDEILKELNQIYARN